MSSPTNVNFDDLIPQPKPDTFNIEWQGSTAVADPNSPDHQVREVSGCYRVPSVGGVLVLADDYEISVTDSGLLLIANSSSPLTFTMPAIIPSLKTGQGIWNVSIKNIGTGALTVDPNGLNLDASASTVPLAQGAALLGISTDGTDYYSTLAIAAPILNFVDEVPSGTINGTNLVFTASHTPNPASSLEIESDGTSLAPTVGYALVGAVATLVYAPVQTLIFRYRY